MVTRKNFRQAAAEISQIVDEAERKSTARTMGNIFAKMNPRFRMSIFLAACNAE